jgi:3-oxoacyl-[acyl-carrier protein] reductase
MGGGVGATIMQAKAAISAITRAWPRSLPPGHSRERGLAGDRGQRFPCSVLTRQILDAALASTPAGTLGTNEEIADTILFLCSHSARFIHGQTIEINGGMFMA